MYYDDNGASIQQGFYNGQPSGMTYDSINNMGAQPQQIQVVHIDVNQIVTTIFQEIKAIMESQQQYVRQTQAQQLEAITMQQSGQDSLAVPKKKYIAVYAYEGFGVFTDEEKLKLRARYWKGGYQWQAFDDYQSAMTCARDGIAKIRNVSIEYIPQSQQLNWMCYMQ